MEAALLIVVNSLGEKDLEVTTSLILIGATILIYVVIMTIYVTFLDKGIYVSIL